ncbi:MAG: cob(I)yrinic acid a,c-diamide adenosyltransferase [Pirellulales bacterium]
MAKIYTRTGDSGDTGLLGGERVRKDALRIETIGCVDETNAAIGVARIELARGSVPLPDIDAILSRVQYLLFDMGAELASRVSVATNISHVSDNDLLLVEAEIDRYEEQLAPLRTFILPGGVAAAAQLHAARCICRRAERRLVQLSDGEMVRGELRRYVNRLSDLLFVLARAVNRANQVADVLWEPTRSVRP